MLSFSFERTSPVSGFHNYRSLTGVINNWTTNVFITHVSSDDWTLLYSGSDVDSGFIFFLNTLLRTFEKQVAVLEHKKVA
jgi:hypothetical protein